MNLQPHARRADHRDGEPPAEVLAKLLEAVEHVLRTLGAADLADGLEELEAEAAQRGIAQQAGRNIQDALGDTLLQTIEGSTENIGKIWTNMLKRLAAQAAAAAQMQMEMATNAATDIKFCGVDDPTCESCQ